MKNCVFLSGPYRNMIGEAVRGRMSVREREGVALAEAPGTFGNPEQRVRLPLEAVTTRLVKTVTG
jgi:hypothetical protein